MRNQEMIISLIFILLSIGLFFWPNKYEKRVDTTTAVRCKARVISVDNSDVHQRGIIKTGVQDLVLKILDGKFKGKTLQASNQLMGYLDRDKIFQKGDLAFVVITFNKDGKIIYVNPQDIYRLNLELWLFAAFALSIIVFGGWTGIRALLSFVFSALVIWKILIPYTLDGVDPIYLSLGVVTILTISIIFLVAGINRKAIAAFVGCFLGIALTCILAIYFTKHARVHGAIMPFSEPLLYAGFGHLDLTGIFIGSIFLAASGAVMDIGMDIAASMNEVLLKKPDISMWQLAMSGINVGRAVLGTMVTTLLLAYCGGYITMLMFFMAQGIPVLQLVNIVYVAGEIIKTLAGSFGLVLTAPFTAFVGAWILKYKRT